MKVFLLSLFVFSLLLRESYGQIRLTVLTVSSQEEYAIIGSDIIVMDTLILQDSATIILNPEHKDNFIHAKVALIGKGVRILGLGDSGSSGEVGTDGFTRGGPCLDGTAGGSGTEGTNGTAGTNLFLYFDDLSINGSLSIDMSGGNGGDGGRGGAGGGGSPGTRVCSGGTGGTGGNGAQGGDGGDSGSITINCIACHDLRTMLDSTLFLRTFGGNAGLGGQPGQGGLPGLGTSSGNSLDGTRGQQGERGQDGIAGKNGVVTFE